MKWELKSFIGGIIVGSVLFSGFAYATSSTPNVEVTKPYTYYFDAVPKSPNTDKQAILYKNSVYVPIRFVAENLGKSVLYDSKTASIYIGKIPTVKMYSKLEAVDLVKKKYLNKISADYKIEFDHEDEKGNYVIHIYKEVVNNFQTGDSYTSTYGYYIVNPSSGAVTTLF
ncbi:stalk domain-containing protein [Brevibacillus ginsengisoli]|uniref:stalk domain-containing protein n=1 Tax=Brevibacillus ginsengisoli TaxID=363854 RepID=UPI003CF21A89